MTPLPPPLGSGALVLWRIDDARFAGGWRLGDGARRFGGRWNSVGVAAVYAALDPATAILEVAVHKGFRVLDSVPHVLTRATITDPAAVHVMAADALPDAGWLLPGNGPIPMRQRYGDEMLRRWAALAVPSSVSRRSWNLILPGNATLALTDIRQEPLVIDPRLHTVADAG